MYNSQEIASRIKEKAKQQNKTINEVLIACELGKNTISKIANGTDIYSKNLAKIADYLNCSVDYLLGREDKYKKGIDIVASQVKGFNMENYNGDTSVLISNVEDWNVKDTPLKNSNIESINENEAELLNVYRSLSFRDKHELMSILYKMQDKTIKSENC